MGDNNSPLDNEKWMKIDPVTGEISTNSPLVPLEDVLKRWEGYSTEDGIELPLELPTFRIKKSLKTNNGEIIYYLSAIADSYIEEYGVGYKKFFCLPKDVLNAEKKHPELLYTRLSIEEIPLATLPPIENPTKGVPCSTIDPTEHAEQPEKKYQETLSQDEEKEDLPASPHDEESFPAEYENHGIFTLVAKCVWERTPVEDIMRLLKDEKFLTQKENGYFFHPSPQGKKVETLRSYTKNMLNPKKRGW